MPRELDEIPVEKPDHDATPEEDAQIEAITKQFGDRLTSDWETRDDATLRDHLFHRIRNQTPTV